MRDVTHVIGHGKRAATLHCILTRIRATCLIDINTYTYSCDMPYVFMQVSFARSLLHVFV